jgi:hypothetical protein
MLRNFIHLPEHRSRLVFDFDSAVVTVFGHREHAAEVNATLLDEGRLPLLNTQPAPHSGGKCGDEGTPQPTPRANLPSRQAERSEKPPPEGGGSGNGL